MFELQYQIIRYKLKCMRRAQDRARSATFKNSGARSATIELRALGALKLASEARDENVPAKRADFLNLISVFLYKLILKNFTLNSHVFEILLSQDFTRLIILQIYLIISENLTSGLLKIIIKYHMLNLPLVFSSNESRLK